ncbi:neurofilament heavy polypeptide-like isoform X2 [Engraulis encrasicolus]
MVPKYIIVGSSFFLALQLLALLGCAQACIYLVLLILLFLFIWLITGSVYVYGAFKPDFESRRSPDYCEKILYEAAFWCTNLAWVTIAVFGTMACCRQICLYCLRDKEEDTEAGTPDPEEKEETEEKEEKENLVTPGGVDEEAGGVSPKEQEKENLASPGVEAETGTASPKEEKEKEKATPNGVDNENKANSAPPDEVTKLPQTPPQDTPAETPKLYPDVATVESETKD